MSERVRGKKGRKLFRRRGNKRAKRVERRKGCVRKRNIGDMERKGAGKGKERRNILGAYRTIRHVMCFILAGHIFPPPQRGKR